MHCPLPCFLMPAQRTPVYLRLRWRTAMSVCDVRAAFAGKDALVRMVVAAEALAAPQRVSDGVFARAMHLAAMAEPRRALALALCVPLPRRIERGMLVPA